MIDGALGTLASRAFYLSRLMIGALQCARRTIGRSRCDIFKPLI